MLALLVAVSIAGRLLLLTARPPWHDEIFTAWAARMPTAGLVEALRLDSGPPLFYLLERPFARAADATDRDNLLRVLPFLAALSLFAAAWTLPRGARRWWVALIACFALVNLYAAEARAYSLLAVLCLFLFALALDGEERPRRLAAVAAVGALALWTHYLALIAVAAALVLALARGRRRSALALAAALLAFAPWIPVLLAQPPSAMAWLLDPPARALPGFLSALGGVGRIPSPFGPPVPRALFAASLAAGAVLSILVFRATRDDAPGRLAALFVFLVLALSLAASVWRPIAFAGRSEMAVLAVWIWAVARAAARDRGVRMAAVAAAALGLAATLFVVAGPHPRPTTTTAVGSLARLARPGDAVLAGPGFYLPARLAADRGRLAASVASLPEGDAAHPGWFVAWPLAEPDVRQAQRLAEGLPPGGRLFLLLPPAYDTPALMAPLAERGRLREIARQDDGVLTVWERSR